MSRYYKEEDIKAVLEYLEKLKEFEYDERNEYFNMGVECSMDAILDLQPIVIEVKGALPESRK